MFGTGEQRDARCRELAEYRRVRVGRCELGPYRAGHRVVNCEVAAFTREQSTERYLVVLVGLDARLASIVSVRNQVLVELRYLEVVRQVGRIAVTYVLHETSKEPVEIIHVRFHEEVGRAVLPIIGGTARARARARVDAGVIALNPTSIVPRLVTRVTALTLALFGLVPVANLLAPGSLPWWSDVVSWWLFGGACVLVIAYVVSRAVGDRATQLGTRARALVMAPSSRTFVCVVSIAGFLLAAGASWYCFNRQPQSIDAMAQLWHARMLLAGHLSIPTEPDPAFFSAMNVVDAGGRWYSQFPVGGPAVLAAGLALGVAWLVNPVLIALTVRNVYRFAQRAYGEAFARAATLLLLVAPFFIFMGASEQNHVPALAFATLALAALPAWASAGSRRDAFRQAAIIGFALGAMATIRPLDALAVAAAIGLYQLGVLVRAKARWADIAVQCVAGAVPVAVLMWANARTTGAPLRFGYEVMWGANQALGFHPSPFGDAHTPRRALVLASLYLMKLDMYLFEWPIPALVAPIIALAWLRRPSTWDALLATMVVAVLGSYALYWHNGHFLGPRFLYTAVPAFVLLAARAPTAIAERVGAVGRTMAYAVMPLGILCALTGWSGPIGIPARLADYRGGQWELKEDIAAQARDAHLGRALVFVHEGWGARLMARMWAIGVSRADAEHLLATSDACALELATDAEERHPRADTVGRAARLAAATPNAARGELHLRGDVTPDVTLRFASAAPLPAECVQEAQADSIGMSLYPPFLTLNRVGPDGRVGGDVVYVRDLGPRNEELRARFGDRTWYRYRPRQSAADTSPPFVRY